MRKGRGAPLRRLRRPCAAGPRRVRENAAATRGLIGRFAGQRMTSSGTSPEAAMRVAVEPMIALLKRP